MPPPTTRSNQMGLARADDAQHCFCRSLPLNCERSPTSLYSPVNWHIVSTAWAKTPLNQGLLSLSRLSISDHHALLDYSARHRLGARKPTAQREQKHRRVCWLRWKFRALRLETCRLPEFEKREASSLHCSSSPVVLPRTSPATPTVS